MREPVQGPAKPRGNSRRLPRRTFAVLVEGVAFVWGCFTLGTLMFAVVLLVGDLWRADGWMVAAVLVTLTLLAVSWRLSKGRTTRPSGEDD